MSYRNSHMSCSRDFLRTEALFSDSAVRPTLKLAGALVMRAAIP